FHRQPTIDEEEDSPSLSINTAPLPAIPSMEAAGSGIPLPPSPETPSGPSIPSAPAVPLPIFTPPVATPSNLPPVVTNLKASFTVSENDTAAIIDNAISVTDDDSPDFDGGN